MSSIAVPLNARAKEIYVNFRVAGDAKTNRLFVGLLLAEWIGGILLAIFVSPYAWEGSESTIHLHVWMAFVLGAMLSLYPVYLVARDPSQRRIKYVIACSQMVYSILFIHLTGGRIETHFYIFCSLGFLFF